MAALSLSQYLDVHPTANWTRNKHDEYDDMLDVQFHSSDIHFTPLCDYLQFPEGVGLNQSFYTGRKMVMPHSNHNPIGWYDRYTTALYADTVERKLVSRKRYGGKVQLDETDELNYLAPSGVIH